MIRRTIYSVTPFFRFNHALGRFLSLATGYGITEGKSVVIPTKSKIAGTVGSSLRLEGPGTHRPAAPVGRMSGKFVQFAHLSRNAL